MNMHFGRSVLAISCLWCASAHAAEDAKQELEKMQGDWIVVSATINGAPVASTDLDGIRRTVMGDEVIWKYGTEPILHTRIKIDPSQTPKHWDTTFLDGDEKGQARLGIYELKDDELKISVAGPAGERPLDFTTKSGDGGIFLVLKKQ